MGKKYLGTISDPKDIVTKEYVDALVGGDDHIELTQAQYNALTPQEKADPDKVYFITDADPTLPDVSVTDSVPIGAIQSYGGSSAPYGWLLCDGSAVSRTTYSELFSVIGTTYGSGDGSTTFNIPDLAGRVITGVGTADGVAYALGDKKSAGVPNITGEYRHSWADASGGGLITPNGDAENNIGAFGNKHSGTAYFGSVSNTSTSDYHANYITFNASKSNPHYGASTTVQPNTTVCNYIIKAKEPTVVNVTPSPVISDLIDVFYPVGSCYETVDSAFVPNAEWGGTWELDDTSLFEEEKEVLWNNPNPLSSFNAQTISIPTITNYDDIECSYRSASGSSYGFLTQKGPVTVGEHICLISYLGNGEITGTLTNDIRLAYIRSSGIEFSAGYYRTASGTTLNNNLVIPQTIVGVKRVSHYRWHRTA